MSEKYFIETQKIKYPLWIVVLISVCIYNAYLLITHLIYFRFTVIVPVILLSVAMLLAGFAIWLVLHLHFKLIITDKAIKYKLSPLHSKKHKIDWDDVDSYEIVETPKFSHWHSGNMRFWKERKFTLTGRNGLRLETKDGLDYFFGVRDLLKLKQSLKKAVENR